MTHEEQVAALASLRSVAEALANRVWDLVQVWEGPNPDALDHVANLTHLVVGAVDLVEP